MYYFAQKLVELINDNLLMTVGIPPSVRLSALPAGGLCCYQEVVVICCCEVQQGERGAVRYSKVCVVL